MYVPGWVSPFTDNRRQRKETRTLEIHRQKIKQSMEQPGQICERSWTTNRRIKKKWNTHECRYIPGLRNKSLARCVLLPSFYMLATILLYYIHINIDRKSKYIRFEYIGLYNVINIGPGCEDEPITYSQQQRTRRITWFNFFQDLYVT